MLFIDHSHGGRGKPERTEDDLVSLPHFRESHLYETGTGCQDQWQKHRIVRRKKSERKNDTLLSYIHHARNADEHTLTEITDKQPHSVKLGVGPGSWNISAMTDAQGNVNASITAMGGQIEGVSKFCEVTSGRVRIMKVVDRGVEYDPPLDGLSNEISPLEAARLAAVRLTKIVEEARKLTI